MSPAMNRIFTISAGDRSVFSAMVCGVAPWITWSTGPDGIAGAAGSGRRRCFGACFGSAGGVGVAGAAGAGAFAAAGAAAAFGFGLARGFRGCGGGSSTSRGLAGAAVALPPDARRRGTMSSGTLEEADFPAHPISASDASSSLLLTPSSLASS